MHLQQIDRKISSFNMELVHLTICCLGRISHMRKAQKVNSTEKRTLITAPSAVALYGSSEFTS